MARGYRLGTGERKGAAWYATLQQADKVRQVRIMAYPANGSEPYLVDLVVQTEAQPIFCPNAVTREKLQAALAQLERLIHNASPSSRNIERLFGTAAAERPSGCFLPCKQ